MRFPTADSGRALLSFFGYELRRHLPTLAVGWVLLAAPVLAYRFVEESWRFWSSDLAPFVAQLAIMLLAPILTLVMAVSGYAGERADGTLEWLYARPLSADAIFTARAAAVVAATVLWIGVALLLYGVSPAELDLWELTAAAAAWGLVAALVALALGSGLLVSALARDQREAYSRWQIAFLVLGFAAPGFVLYALPSRPALLTRGGGVLLMTAGNVYVALLAGGALLVAWWTLRRGPGDARRSRRHLTGAAAVAVVALGVYTAILLQPLAIDPGAVAMVRTLGGGATLELARARGIEEGVYHPVIHRADGARIVHRDFVHAAVVFSHPGSGHAMLRRVSGWQDSRYRPASSWLRLDRAGGSHTVELEEAQYQEPVGFSRDGRRFAWRTLYGSRYGLQQSSSRDGRVLVLGDDLRLHRIRVAVPAETAGAAPVWTAAWLDAERLLIASEPVQYTFIGSFLGHHGSRHWWSVISADSEALVDPQLLPEGRRIFAAALAYSPDELVRSILRTDSGLLAVTEQLSTFSPAAVSRRGTSPVFLLAGGSPPEVAALDTESWQWISLAAVEWLSQPRHAYSREDYFLTTGVISLGALADGTLVWLERHAVERSRVRALGEADSEPRTVCVFEHSAYGIGGFRGASGGWAVWADSRERSLYACHPGSGNTRVLDDLGRLAARSAEVTADGILTPAGRIDLEEPR